MEAQDKRISLLKGLLNDGVVPAFCELSFAIVDFEAIAGATDAPEFATTTSRCQQAEATCACEVRSC